MPSRDAEVQQAMQNWFHQKTQDSMWKAYSTWRYSVMPVLMLMVIL